MGCSGSNSLNVGGNNPEKKHKRKDYSLGSGNIDDSLLSGKNKNAPGNDYYNYDQINGGEGGTEDKKEYKDERKDIKNNEENPKKIVRKYNDTLFVQEDNNNKNKGGGNKIINNDSDNEDGLDKEDNKASSKVTKKIVPPAIDQLVIEGNDNKNPLLNKSKYKGMVILENIKEYIPEDISRDEIKEMVYNSLGNTIVEDSAMYVQGKNLTKDQTDGIIDYLMGIIQNNENVNGINVIDAISDRRLDGVNVKIGFHSLSKDIIRNIMFKGENPSEDDVDDMFRKISNNESDVKLLIIELQE